MAAYRARNKPKLRALNHVWNAANSDHMRRYRRDYRAKNKDKIAADHRAYAERNQEHVQRYQRAYKVKNAERLRLARRTETAKVKHRARAMSFYRAHQRELQAKRRERYRKSPEFRLRVLLQSRLIYALRSQSVAKTAGTKELVGCDLSFLRRHIEKQFKPGMTWDNHGEWHIDHIKPCASFCLLDPGQQRLCFHWRNLQPLWKLDNMRKGATVTTNQPAMPLSRIALESVPSG